MPTESFVPLEQNRYEVTENSDLTHSIGALSGGRSCFTCDLRPAVTAVMEPP